MKVRPLLLVSAFVLGDVAVSYLGDAIEALREYKYTSPLCVVVETAWADATGASRTRLEAELAQRHRRLVQLEQEKLRLEESLDVQIQELGRADAHIAKLVSELDHSERVRDTMSGELNHCRQLIDSQEAMVRETNWRYSQLTQRIRELGDGGALSVLVRE